MKGAPPKYFSSWIDIDLDALVYNFDYITKRVAPAQVIAVIKANAIGHGSRMVGKTLQEAGARILAVSNFFEGLDLRNHGITVPVLVMNGLMPEQMEIAIEKDLSFFGFDGQAVETANTLARKIGKQARIHLKVDTGMGRLGILPKDAPAFAEVVKSLDWVQVEGIASHLASPYIPDHDEFSMKQYELFVQACETLDPEHRAIRHFAASAGTLRFPEAYSDAVRFQALLYGLARVWPLPWPLKPVASYKAKVVQVKILPKGHNVGYLLHYTCPEDTRIAIVPVGTADGLTGEHSDTGHVLIRGKRCRIVGVCCCEMMVDATDVPDAAVGDEVVLIGSQNGTTLTAPDFAGMGNTTYTNVLAKTSLRNPKVYWKGGKLVGIDQFAAPFCDGDDSGDGGCGQTS